MKSILIEKPNQLALRKQEKLSEQAQMLNSLCTSFWHQT